MKAIIAILLVSGVALGFTSGLYVESKRSADVPKVVNNYSIKDMKGKSVLIVDQKTDEVDTLGSEAAPQRTFKRGLLKRIFRKRV